MRTLRQSSGKSTCKGTEAAHQDINCVSELPWKQIQPTQSHHQMTTTSWETMMRTTFPSCSHILHSLNSERQCLFLLWDMRFWGDLLCNNRQLIQVNTLPPKCVYVHQKTYIKIFKAVLFIHNSTDGKQPRCPWAVGWIKHYDIFIEYHKTMRINYKNKQHGWMSQT